MSDITPSEYRGEIRLWQAVVMQIAYDALTKKRVYDSEGIAAHNKAIAMLEATHGSLREDLELLCQYAGLCPVWVRRKYRYMRDTLGYIKKAKKCQL